MKWGIEESAATVAGIFDSVTTDPDILTLEGCAEDARTVEAGLLVFVGGGNVIDTAKAALVQLCENDDLASRHRDEYSPSDPLLPHLTVPNTAGTGS